MIVHCLTVETFDVKGLAEISSGTMLPIIDITFVSDLDFELSRISILNL